MIGISQIKYNTIYDKIYFNSHILQTSNSSIKLLGEKMKMKNGYKQMKDEDDEGISVTTLIKSRDLVKNQ